jgi:hypothetical protein
VPRGTAARGRPFRSLRRQPSPATSSSTGDRNAATRAIVVDRSTRCPWQTRGIDCGREAAELRLERSRWRGYRFAWNGAVRSRLLRGRRWRSQRSAPRTSASARSLAAELLARIPRRARIPRWGGLPAPLPRDAQCRRSRADARRPESHGCRARRCDTVFVGATPKAGPSGRCLVLQHLLNTGTTDQRFRNAGSARRKSGPAPGETDEED